MRGRGRKGRERRTMIQFGKQTGGEIENLCVCECVREREREREKKKKKIESVREKGIMMERKK
jgi:hypothetical protein